MAPPPAPSAASIASAASPPRRGEGGGLPSSSSSPLVPSNTNNAPSIWRSGASGSILLVLVTIVMVAQFPYLTSTASLQQYVAELSFRTVANEYSMVESAVTIQGSSSSSSSPYQSPNTSSDAAATQATAGFVSADKQQQQQQQPPKQAAEILTTTTTTTTTTTAKSLMEKQGGITMVLPSDATAEHVNEQPEDKLVTVTNATESTTEPSATDATAGHTAVKELAATAAAVAEEALSATATSVPRKKNYAHPPLNVIVLYPDDMRHDSLSCAGTQAVQTPFLDRIASEGIRFTHNCVTTSICWISRATLFSGQYINRHKAQYLFRPISEEKWQYTYPALLRQHGYYLGHIGKWQYRNTEFVRNVAFDYAFVYEGVHIFKMKGQEIHVTDRNRIDAIDFLRTRPKDRKFALQVAFYAPKAVGQGDMQWTPMQKSMSLYNNLTLTYPPGMNESYYRLPSFFRENSDRFEARKRWQQRFGTPQKFDASMKNYYRMITEVDEAVGAIYQELEAQGILNETMIIFTTDNGFFHSEHGLSGKWFPYQESIRVPLIIRDPRIPKEKIGTTNDDFTLNIDLASTILGAAGLESHPVMQGRDISDLYLQDPPIQPPWRDEFFYVFPSKGKAILPGATALVRKDFKLFRYPEWNIEQLFHLKEDPLEEYDLSRDPKYASILNEMRIRHDELEKASY